MQDKETIKNINNGIVEIMMPMYNELIELRSKLSSLSSGPEYRKVKTKFDDLKEQYSLFGKSNDMIVKFTSKEQVQRELQRIISERERLYKEFIALKEEYTLASKRGASVNELNLITSKARKISPIINCYDKLILVFNKSLGRSVSNKITRIEKPIMSSKPKPEVKKEEKRIEPKKKEVKSVKQVNEYLSDPDIKIIYDSSKKIQMLKGELFKHPQGSPKAKYLSNLIYDLCEQRESMVTKLLGPEVISKVSVIESMEDAAYSKPDVVPLKPYSVNASEFSSELSDLVNILGDLKFNELESKTYLQFRKSEEERAKQRNIPYTDTESQTYKKVYEISVRKYKNLLNAVIGNDRELSSMKDDLLVSLTAFNLTGGYSAFKKKHKNGKIGGNAISKDVYIEGLDTIKELISKLDTYSSKYISSKGGKITITDSLKTRSQMIGEVNSEYAKLFEQIESKKQETIEARA